jgi:hypothetical protein
MIYMIHECLIRHVNLKRLINLLILIFHVFAACIRNYVNTLVHLTFISLKIELKNRTLQSSILKKNAYSWLNTQLSYIIGKLVTFCNLYPTTHCTYLSQDLHQPAHVMVFLLVFNDLRWEMVCRCWYWRNCWQSLFNFSDLFSEWSFFKLKIF